MIRLLRTLLVTLGLGAVLGLPALGLVFLQDSPRLVAMPPPSPEDVAATRQLVRDIRATAGSDDALLRTNADQLNSAVRLGARFIRGFRGQITAETGAVLGEVSIPVPWITGQKWLNVTGRVPAFDGPFRLAEVTVGGVTVPPALALSAARMGANVLMGNGFGDTVVTAASALRIETPDLVFRIALDRVGQNGVMREVFSSVRGSRMPTPAEIDGYHARLRAAMADGTLSGTGSFLPYLQFSLRAALENSTAETLPNAYTAAIFGLAKACGARGFSLIVGRLAFDRIDRDEDWTTSCEEITFNGRVDSRRHFLTSAALQAASNTGVAVSIGEFKELYDTISGAGGFDFTDMAANLSGIRLSNVMMAAPPSDWPALLALIENESDVIVPYDGIPGLMPQETFKARFSDLESVAYKEMIARIEARIDTLRLYRAR